MHSRPIHPGPLTTPLRLGTLQLGQRIFLTSHHPLADLEAQALAGPHPLVPNLLLAAPQRLVLCTLAPAQVLRALGAVDSGLHTADEVNRWRVVTAAIHARGGLAVARLGNVMASVDGYPNADELDEALDAYRTAAENASDAGFDGVELIGTNGSLPWRLVRAASELAGTLGARVGQPMSLDFLAGACQALLGSWPADRVGLSLSLPRSATHLELAARSLLAIDSFDLAFLHLTAMTGPQSRSLGGLVSRLRPLFRGGVLVSGEWTRELAEAAVARGDVDAVGMDTDPSQARSIAASRAERGRAG